jgi:2',3'-cyclic-nucleotide 2'-phosphodiesterase
MRILFVGDIIGSPGREMVRRHLMGAKEKFGVDIAIINAENVAAGFGITQKTAAEMMDAGVDMMTSGNHIWDKPEVVEVFKKYPLIRPLNYPIELGGESVKVLEVGNERLAVVNLMGHFSMPISDNPFRLVRAVVDTLKNDGIENIFIDFHAETTSEKEALWRYLEADVSFIVGTHTHIGTDDLRITNGCGFLADVGLTGCRDGVIGVDKDGPIYRFLTGTSKRFVVNKECKKIFQALVCDIEGGRCTSAFKIKAYDDSEFIVSQEAFIE